MPSSKLPIINMFILADCLDLKKATSSDKPTEN